MNRTAALVLAATVPALAAMMCVSPPLVQNSTGAELYVEIVFQDGGTFSGVIESGFFLGERSIERLEIRRADGTTQRFDRERLELLAKDLPDRTNVIWRIEAEGVRALPYSGSQALEQP
jgi:hypothetical protein